MVINFASLNYFTGKNMRGSMDAANIHDFNIELLCA